MLMALVPTFECYSMGAPDAACNAMTPGHSLEPQKVNQQNDWIGGSFRTQWHCFCSTVLTESCAGQPDHFWLLGSTWRDAGHRAGSRPAGQVLPFTSLLMMFPMSLLLYSFLNIVQGFIVKARDFCCCWCCYCWFCNCWYCNCWYYYCWYCYCWYRYCWYCNYWYCSPGSRASSSKQGTPPPRIHK